MMDARLVPVDAPVWLDFGDKFASIVGAVTGALGLYIGLRDRGAGSAEEEPGSPRVWRRWVRAAAVSGVFPLVMLALRGGGLVPGFLRWGLSVVALTASVLACVCVVLAWVAFRRQSMRLPAAVRSLLAEQWQDARRHQYEYFVGDAPPLPEIYVEQKAESVLPPVGASPSAVPRLLTIQQMIRGFRNMVVVAEPGAGKSTAVALVLREQCRWWLDARRSDAPGDAPCGSVVPVLVPAELLADRSVAEAMAAHCRQVTGRAVAAELFEQPPAAAEAWLVLVDGVDQVLSTRQRSRVLSRLGDVVARDPPHLRFMITTRPLMLGELGNLAGEHVARFTLRRFDRQDLARFARRWVAHRERTHMPELDLEPITIERFLTAVSSSRLSAIARVPLIATITALILEADQDSALPTSRAGLYERFIEHLLSSRQAGAEQRERLTAEFARHGERGRQAWVWLSENLRDLLEGTADVFLSGAGTRVTASAAAWVREHAPPDVFEEIPGWESSLRGALTATSLIVPRTGGLQFAHPSFAEYLAAGPRSRDFDRGSWLADARSPDGRNLALFTLARSTYSADPLVTMLMERGGTDACIAGEIVADGIAVGASLRKEVISRLFSQLSRDERSAPEALTVLVNLAWDEQVLRQLTDLVEDGECLLWVRAFTADALCGVTVDGAGLLRSVLDAAAGEEGAEVRRWILERLAAQGEATGQERALLAAMAPAGVFHTSTSAMAAQWYQQIADDADADPAQRLRALLTLADGGNRDALGSLGNIIVLPALTPEVRLDAARTILQLSLNEPRDVLRGISRDRSRGLEIRVPILAALAGARDDGARALLDELAADGGEEFAARFPALASWLQETGVRSTEQETSATPRVWGGIPPRNPYFIGRNDTLNELTRRFREGEDVDRTQVLHGLGGVGKTQVAIEYAYRYRGEYDVVWWVPADQQASLRGALAELAPHLGLPSASVIGVEPAMAAVVGALQRGEPYDTWLLIFDNGDQPDEFANLLPHGPGHVLITSRNHRWEREVPALPLDVFTRSESVEFLRYRLPGIDERTADTLAENLADFATSLEAAAALMAETGQPAEEYVVDLGGRTADLLASGRPSEYPETLQASLDAAVAQLSQEDPQAERLLRYCAMFGPEPIPFDTLGGLGRSAGQTPGLITDDPVQLLSAIDRLERYGLVTVDRGLRTLQLIRLVMAMIRKDVAPDEAASMRHAVHLMLAAFSPPDPCDSGTWPLYVQLVGHVTPTLLERCSHPDCRDLLLNVARYLTCSGDHTSCNNLIEQAIDSWAGDPGDQRMQQAHLIQATALRRDGDHDNARKASQRAWETAGEERKPAAAQSLAVDLRIAGSFSTACDLDRQTVTRYTELHGENDARTLQASHYLALDLELEGDYDAAGERHLAIHRAAPHRGDLAALSLSGAARALRLRGDHENALPLAADADALAQLPPGIGRRAQAVIRRELGVAWRLAPPRSGSFLPRHSAKPSELIAQSREMLTNAPLDDLVAMVSMGNALRAEGDLEQANSIATEALDRCMAALGPEHPFASGCASNLAVIRRLIGHPEQARDLNQAALQGLTRTVGADHPHSMVCATNLASDHSTLGDLDEAIDLATTTLATLRARLGPAHPITLACALNLSTDLRLRGDHHASNQLRHHVTTSRPHLGEVAEEQRLDPDIELIPLGTEQPT
jgi:hypothetical protein